MSEIKSTANPLLGGQLTINQPERGPRVSQDPFLLADFVRLQKGDRFIDLGCGVGPIALTLALRYRQCHGVGVDIDAESIELALRNSSENNLELDFINCDWNDAPAQLGEGSFSWVVSNPPYRTVGAGRSSPDPARSRARHMPSGEIERLLAATYRLLKGKGRAGFIYLAEGSSRLQHLLIGAGLEPKRLRYVYPREGREAVLVMIEARKNGRPGVAIEPPLYIHDADGYTAEAARILGLKSPL